MEKPETLENFYKKKFNAIPETLQQGVGHFNVFRINECPSPAKEPKPITYSRRDFYKVCLFRGKTIYHYADKSLSVDGSTLIFFNGLSLFDADLDDISITAFHIYNFSFET